MVALKISEKKEWAQNLITQQDYTQKEAAEKVGVSTVTMNKWYKKGNWEELKQSMLVTRQAQLKMMYMQLDELNTAIMNRPKGERFPNSKESDTQNKLSGNIKAMETEASLHEVIEVSKQILNYIRGFSAAKALEFASLIDDFIKHRLKQ